MNPEDHRRSQRYTDFLPLSVSVRKQDDDSLVSGPFSARIVDISNHGACLIMTRVMMHSFHIFHSTREDDTVNIILQIDLPSQKDTIKLAAQPVWMDATKLEDVKVFKMGVDFLETINQDLLKTLSRTISTQ